MALPKARALRMSLCDEGCLWREAARLGRPAPRREIRVSRFYSFVSYLVNGIILRG